jgi:hypothetical protein
VQEYTLSTHLHRKISSDVAARCASQQDPRTLQFCEVLERDRAEFEAAGCFRFSGDRRDGNGAPQRAGPLHDDDISNGNCGC